MRNFLTRALIVLVATFGCLPADAGYVKGYHRRDGTYVAPHYRNDSSARSGDSFSLGSMPTSAKVVIVICVVLLGVAICIPVVQSMNSKKNQKKIDEAHNIEYKKWHDMVVSTGNLASVPCDLILSGGEECLRVENNVTLFEVRSVRHSTHTFGSMPIGKSGIRIGRGYSTSESSDEWRPVAKGVLYVTNKQVYFDGDKQDRKVPIAKISTVKADLSAMEISSATRQKSMLFVGVNGNICREIVLCASGQGVFANRYGA